MSNNQKEQSIVQKDDRRQYFRIKHSLFMSYECLSQNKQFNTEEKQERVTEPKSQPSIHMLKELHKIEEENSLFITELKSEQSTSVDYIKQLNQKIEKLNQFIIKNLDLEYSQRIEVDLSGGGIRFESKTALKVEQLLTMELILMPEYHNVLTLGKVVICKKNQNKFYDIAVNFEQIKEADRDAIIKHIFQIQSKQLRQDKLD